MRGGSIIKFKPGLLLLIFCLLLIGCKSEPTSTGVDLKQQIQLDKDVVNTGDTQAKHISSAAVTDRDDIQKIESALNKEIMPKGKVDFEGKEIYSIQVMKEIEKGKWTKTSYTLWKLSEDEYLIRTGSIDMEKEWWIIDVDMVLNGIFERYLK